MLTKKCGENKFTRHCEKSFSVISIVTALFNIVEFIYGIILISEGKVNDISTRNYLLSMIIFGMYFAIGLVIYTMTSSSWKDKINSFQQTCLCLGFYLLGLLSLLHTFSFFGHMISFLFFVKSTISGADAEHYINYAISTMAMNGAWVVVLGISVGFCNLK
jgi:heme A synthase